MHNSVSTYTTPLTRCERNRVTNHYK